jgi:hypothetical protein
MKRLFAFALVALAAVSLIAGPAAAEGASLQVTDLRVVDEWPWQPSDDHWISWEANFTTDDVEWIEYRVWNAAGEQVEPLHRGIYEINRIEYPWLPAPGTYELELWARALDGTTGPHAWLDLHYDDAAPPAPTVRAPARWLAGDEPAQLTIEPPEVGSVTSGISGYAVSTDRGGGSRPCVRVSRCRLSETSPFGTLGDTVVSLGSLAEGTTVARVVAVSGAGTPSAIATASFHVDATRPLVRLSGVPTGWAASPVRVEATATDELSGMGATGSTGPFTALRIDGAAATTVPGPKASAVVSGSGAHTVAYYARDAAGNVADGSAGAPAPETAVVRIDEDPPLVLFAERQDPAEPERIEASVADSLSGPSQVRGSISLRPAGSKAPFEQLPTRVTAGRLVAVWDSDSYPDGKYEFRATGYDTAGNSAIALNRARGGRMVLVNPLKARVLLESGLRGAGSKRTVPYGRGARFEGRLLAPGGSPLAGQEVAVTETFAAGSAQRQRTAYVRTGTGGRFSTWLGPGPTREVAASFAGTKLLTRAAGTSALLQVMGAVGLRTSSRVARVGGRPIVFSGRLASHGAAIPRHGRPIQLQYRFPGASWRTFRTVQTDRRGSFRYRYAFSDDDSRGVRFQFRAYAPAEDGWPYEDGYSRPVAVLGR